MSEGNFFKDLAVVMAISGFAAVVFSRLKWPKVFGYILVGVLLNEHTWGGSFLVDVASIRTLSQLGIVFLMFSMGLEFSTSDMKQMKGVSVPTALIDTLMMTWLGYLVGTHVFGWSTVQSLFLGVAICDSATTLLAKVVGEIGWAGRKFVKNAMATSVCEDIICVGLIALITGIDNGEGMHLSKLVISLGGLFVFFLSVIVFGFVLVPRLLKSIQKRKDDEALLMAVLGLCFFVSWVAEWRDYSLALGAFLVGIVCSTSVVKERLSAMAAPMKTMFAAMFFMSIGLLVDPLACWHNALPILILTVTVVVGKGANCLVGGLLAGLPVKQAVQMAMSLAQVGEFAFMVALLYAGQTGDATNPMFQVTIGASLLTSLLNPFMIRSSERVGTWAERACPKRLTRILATYRAFLAKYHDSGETEARRKVRVALIELGVIAALESAVAAVCGMLSHHDWTAFSVWFERYDQYVFFLVFNVFALAMLALLLGLMRTLARALCTMLIGLGSARWQQISRQFVILFVYAAVLFGWLAEALMINTALTPDDGRMEWGMLILLALIVLFGWKLLRRAGFSAKKNFDEALRADARLNDLGKMITLTVPEDTLNEVTVGPTSPAVGGTVVSLNIRARTGASVVAVVREGVHTRNIGPEWVFRAGDTLVAMGEDAQLAALKALVAGEEKEK